MHTLSVAQWMRMSNGLHMYEHMAVSSVCNNTCIFVWTSMRVTRPISRVYKAKLWVCQGHIPHPLLQHSKLHYGMTKLIKPSFGCQTDQSDFFKCGI